MKVVHCPNTPDGHDYDVWEGNKLLGRFKSRRVAERFTNNQGWLYVSCQGYWNAENGWSDDKRKATRYPDKTIKPPTNLKYCRWVPANIQLNSNCLSEDGDIHRMFMQGATFSEIQDMLYLNCSTQAIQRYVSQCRKFEPDRWPYRRLPYSFPKGELVVLGYYMDKLMKDELPSSFSVFVGLWEGTEFSCYCPQGQHSKVSREYIQSCKPISKEDYVKYSNGLYTPAEYLGEKVAVCSN